MNKLRHVIYKLYEGNTNNPANLDVGQDVVIHKADDESVGVLELITNDYITVRELHTGESHNYYMTGFNNDTNKVEFKCIEDPELVLYL